MPDGGSRRAVIFDLDGTLVSTLDDILAALNRVMAEEGLRAIGAAEGRLMIGGGAHNLIELAFGAAGAPGDPRIEPAFARFIDYYAAEPARLSRPFPGAVAALDRLAADGHVFGICTNKPHDITLRLLEALDLDRYFGAAVLGGDALPVRKPDAGHLLAVLSQTGAEPADAVMVGDSATDVKTARNAGMKVVAVNFGYTAVPAHELGADRVIGHFDELEEALAGLRYS